MPQIQLEDQTPSLLILPPLPTPLKRASLWSAYRETFESLLPKAVPRNKDLVSRLDVAVALSSNRPEASRTSHYPEDQLIWQEVYTLVCLAAARSNVELDFPGGIDVRVILLEPVRSNPDSIQAARRWLSGPVTDIQTFAASSRTYSTIYGVEGEAGEATLQSVLQELRNQRKDAPPFLRLPSGPSIVTTGGSTEAAIVEDKSTRIHRDVINGGTFDHLHLGHKLLLTATVYLSDPSPSSDTERTSRSITFGTTGDELLVNKKHPEQLESWETRQQRTHDFVHSILAFAPSGATTTTTSSNPHLDVQQERINNPGPNGKIVRVTYTLKAGRKSTTLPSATSTLTTTAPESDDIIDQVIVNYTQISDPYGPTITVEKLTALVISAETRAGGKAVNDKRRDKGWHDLDIFEVGVLDAKVDEDELEVTQKEGFDGKLSSTDIRRRLADVQKQLDGKNGGGKL